LGYLDEFYVAKFYYSSETHRKQLAFS